MSTFCVPRRGQPVLQGNYETPASAMARGLAVVRSADTIAKAGAGSMPYGFLNHEVTLDGPSYEERVHIPTTIIAEVKVSEGVIQVVKYQPGIEYVMKGNTKSGTVFAVGEEVVIAPNGEFTDAAGGTSGGRKIGRVEEIGVTHMGESDCVVWTGESDLGTV